MADNEGNTKTSTKVVDYGIISLAGIGSIIAIPYYLNLYWHDFTPLKRNMSIGICIICLMFFTWRLINVWKTEKNRNVKVIDESRGGLFPANLADRDEEIKKRWFHQSHHSILDCINEEGDKVVCTLDLEIKCIEPCQQFYQKIGPADTIIDLIVEGGKREVRPNKANQIPILINLDKPAVVGEVVFVKIIYTILDTFSDDSINSWTIAKIYEGSIYKITVKLPPTRPARSISASIHTINSISDGSYAMECVKYYTLQGRSIIEVTEDKGRLGINQELMVEWGW